MLIKGHLLMAAERKKILIDNTGNLVDEFGRKIELNSSEKYSFNINQRKYAGKGHNVNKFMNLDKSRGGREALYDWNLPKKISKQEDNFVFSSQVLMPGELAPDVE